MYTFKNLTEKEYSEFVFNHELNHFLQSYEWGQFSKLNKNVVPHYVGLVDEQNNIVASALLLEENYLYKYKTFYAPRGFMLDFKNVDLLKTFTKEIKQYIKKLNGISLTIDPNIQYQEIDDLAKPIKDGKNNYEIFNNIINSGYVHQGFNKLYESNQPRYTFRLNLLNDELKQNHVYEKSFERNVKKSFDYNLTLTKKPLLDEFSALLEETAKRDEFKFGGKKYYEDFYHIFNKKYKSVLYSLELNIEEVLEHLKEEKIKLEQKLNKKNIKEAFKLELESRIKRNEFRKELFSKYKDEKNIVVSSYLTVFYGNKMWTMYLGNSELARETNAGTRIYFEIIEDIKKSDDYYIIDFFGTVGDPFTKYKNLAGIFQFKKKLNGDYIEFLGDFDLIINKPIYFFKKLTFKLKQFLRGIKRLLIRK